MTWLTIWNDSCNWSIGGVRQSSYLWWMWITAHCYAVFLCSLTVLRFRLVEGRYATQPKNDSTSIKLKIEPETVDIGVISNYQCVETYYTFQNEKMLNKFQSIAWESILHKVGKITELKLDHTPCDLSPNYW